MKARKLISLLILASMLVSCGGGAATTGDETTAAVLDTTIAAAEDDRIKYDYPNLDLKGESYTILNMYQEYLFYGSIDFDEATGDTLDDAVYTRNRAVEEKFNFKLEVNEENLLDATATALQTAVLAGDAIYDAVFMQASYFATSISEGYLKNLDDISTIDLTQPWWDEAATKASQVGKNAQTLFTVSDISLIDFEGTTCLFFNKDMAEDLGLDAPYDLVREGKWTLDQFGKYLKAGANINGDESWARDENGKSIYGITTWNTCYPALAIGAGAEFINLDKDNIPKIQVNTEKYLDVAARIAAISSVEGEFLISNDTGMNTPLHYEIMFKNGRAFMLCAELKASNSYRDMTYDFGIVPMPKYDESQEEYHSLRGYPVVMAIPVTNSRSEETGAILDAMSYLTHVDVMPAFYEGKLMQKQLRDEDSIEMLNLIRDTRYFDMGYTFGWSGTLRDSLSSTCNNKSTDFASANATNVPTVQAKIDKFLETIGG